MSERLIIDNPFHEGNASASAFGWAFQVDAAIFLFVKYIDSVDSIFVEGKYQDIELRMKDQRIVYAQAKSISNGSNENNKKKLEDAVISLVKTPYTRGVDELLYISNYETPIKNPLVFGNKIVKLKNIATEKEEFEKQINLLKEKLHTKMERVSGKEQKLISKLLDRVEKLDIDEFMVSAIYPYIHTEGDSQMDVIIYEAISKLLAEKFCVTSQYLNRYVREILIEWQTTFMRNATMPVNNFNKKMTKTDLLWQIIAVLSTFDENICNYYDDYLDDASIDCFEEEFSRYRVKNHERFQFVNRLNADFKAYMSIYQTRDKKEFVKKSWKNYLDEFKELSDLPDESKEYIIKKYIVQILSSWTNINKIMGGTN